MQNPHDWVRDETFELWNKYHPECKPKKEYRIKTGFGSRADLAIFVGPDSYPIGVEIVDSHAYEPIAGIQKNFEKILAKGETTTLESTEKLLELTNRIAEISKILNYLEEKDKTHDWNAHISALEAGSALIVTLFAMTDHVLLNAFLDKLIAQGNEWQNILESDQRDRFIELFTKWFEHDLRLIKRAKIWSNLSRHPTRKWKVIKDPSICPKCGSKGTIKWNRIELIEESEKERKEKGFDYCESCDFKSDVRVQDFWKAVILPQ